MVSIDWLEVHQLEQVWAKIRSTESTGNGECSWIQLISLALEKKTLEKSLNERNLLFTHFCLLTRFIFSYDIEYSYTKFHDPHNWKTIQFGYQNRLLSMILHHHWIEYYVGLAQTHRIVQKHRLNYPSDRIYSIEQKMHVSLHLVRCQSTCFLHKQLWAVLHHKNSSTIDHSTDQK